VKFIEREKGGKFFLKLKPGESATGIFRGDPHTFRSHWVAGRSVLCTAEKCEHCKQGHRASFKFRLNFVTKENGTYVAKIFEQGGTVYDYLQSMHSADYDLEKTIVKITRHGIGTDTTYQIVPLPNGQVNAAQLKHIAHVKLHDLAKPTVDDSDGGGGSGDAEGAPIF
jgi:hypothetical protein